MSIVLHHHPFSRAATVVWMLEEVGAPYELRYVDIMRGDQKGPSHTALNPMGKVPVLRDGEALITESAAIATYLADRYALGTLAPHLDDPRRGTYLRWLFYAPSVIEPCCMAKASNWTYRAGSAGFGTYDAMLATLDAAIGEGPWVMGDDFTMADVVFGGTLRWMVQFGMLDKRPNYLAYIERLDARPAYVRAQAVNARVVQEQGLGG